MSVSEFHKHLDSCDECVRDPYCDEAERLIKQLQKNMRVDRRKGNSGNVDAAHPWRNTKSVSK